MLSKILELLAYSFGGLSVLFAEILDRGYYPIVIDSRMVIFIGMTFAALLLVMALAARDQ